MHKLQESNNLRGFYLKVIEPSNRVALFSLVFEMQLEMQFRFAANLVSALPSQMF